MKLRTLLLCFNVVLVESSSGLRTCTSSSWAVLPVVNPLPAAWRRATTFCTRSIQCASLANGFIHIYIHIFIHGFTMFHNVHHFKSCAVALQLYFCGALFVARTPHRPPPGLRADPLETSLVTWEPSHDKRGYWREGTNKRNCFCARFISLNLIAIAHTWPSKTWAAAGTAHAGLLADCCRSYQV